MSVDSVDAPVVVGRTAASSGGEPSASRRVGRRLQVVSESVSDSSGRLLGVPTWALKYLSGLITIDLLVASATLFAIFNLANFPVSYLWFVVLAFSWPIGLAAAGGYRASQIGLGSSELSAVLRAGVYLVVVVVFVQVLFSVSLVTLTAVTVPILVLLGVATRFVMRKVVHHQQARGKLMRGVIAVGSLSAVRHLTAVISREPHCGLHVVGVCVPANKVDDASDLGLNVVGDLDNVAAAVSANRCDAVAVAAGQSPDYLRRLSWSLEGVDVELLVNPGVVEVSGPRMHLRPHVGLPLLHVEHPTFSGWKLVIKRGTDVILSGLGLLVTTPFLVAIALAIKLTDKGPILFRQVRVGVGGKSFTMLKFRSMVADAPQRLAALAEANEGGGVLFKIADDPRITRIGKFLRRYSLDELPQLLNVLRGDMSLVGPRPPLPAEVAQYADEVHRRLLVKPGLTGLWQVSGRSLLSWEESVRLDLRYVENWGLSTDLLLMWKTVWAVLARRGAF